MTLAGTRPPTLDEWEKYELHHRARLAIKPGITKVYSFMHIKEIFDAQGNPTAVLGDTGFPYYIAQFGTIGITL